MTRKRCRVIENYESPYTESWAMIKGEILTVGEEDTEWTGWIWCTNKDGESRWVPENYLKIHGTTGKAKKDYNSTELCVKIGEELIIDKEEAEWFWVTNQHGKKGWVPVRNVEIINKD